MRRAARLLAASQLALTAAACVPGEPSQPIPPRYEYTPPAPPPFAPMAPPQPALPTEPAPLGRLPTDVRPVHSTLVIQIDPTLDRFSGTVEITVDLTRPRDVLWLHGKGLHARSASVRLEGSGPVPATYGEVDPSGVAGLRLAAPIGPGRATIRIDYDAAFGRTGEGLYTVESAGKRYAFTQLEAISARNAFPCFDEPAFKIPFDVTLFVPRGMEAIANTAEIARLDAAGETTRITYATTAPLPSYLLAFAVGPLDVVAAPAIPPNAVRRRPLALRGVAAQGRGKDLAYALAHTGEMVAMLETYFGIEYPFDKLDMIAVPDKRGAMENAGAITFGERLLLVDEATAPTAQKRAFWSVGVHELAHQWFGDLVTMPWWDDTWLNEAFATWSQARILPSLRPEDVAEIEQLRGTQEVMGLDSLVSSRQVRQDVRGPNDIANAFDHITYRKGAGVIGMFERWIGRDSFRAGVSSYLNAHRGGNATADDLFAALSAAAARDVGTPFRSFINQPGVPLVSAQLTCGPAGNALALTQARHLPLGSAGDPNRTWQIPVCATFPDGKTTREACTLLTGPQGTLPLPGNTCPAWVMPNAGAAGYYLFTMPLADMKKLTTTAYKRLAVPERLALVHAVRTSFNRGTPVAELLPLLTPLAGEPERQVVQAVMDPFRIARSWFTRPAEREAIEKQAQRVFAPVWKKLGWAPAKDKVDDDERRSLRADVLSFMTLVARDATVRKEAASRGRAYVGYGTDAAFHPDAADKDLLGVCLAVAAEDGDAAFFDHLLGALGRAPDDVVRNRVIGALGSFRAADLAGRARALTFDARIPAPELTSILENQLGASETRDAAWQWLQTRVDDLAAKRPPARRGSLPWLGTVFCDRAHAAELGALFADRIQKIDGGPRNLAGALEAIHLCAARRSVQEPSFRKAFKIPEPRQDKPRAGGPPGVVDPFAPKVAPGAAAPGSPAPVAPAPAPGPGGKAQPKDGVADPWSTKVKPGARPPPTAGTAPAPARPGGVIDPWTSPKKKP